MAKASVVSDRVGLAGKIRRGFNLHRRASGSGQPRYPAKLIELVISALEGGGSVSDVAKWAGVSRVSVMNWMKSGRNSLQELRVLQDTDVSEALVGRAGSGGGASVARVCFRSGVVIELPVEDLNVDLIQALSRVGES